MRRKEKRIQILDGCDMKEQNESENPQFRKYSDKPWWQEPIYLFADAVTNAFKQMKPWLRVVFIFMALFFIATYFLFEKISPVVIEMTKTSEEKAMDRNEVNLYIDSLTMVRREKFTKEAIVSQKEINKSLTKLKNAFNGVSYVTIWKIHDHGGPLNNGEPKYISIIYATEDLPDIDLQESWSKRIAPLGYINLAQRTFEEGRVYLPSVVNDKFIYFGQAKESLDLLGTKSIMSSYVKTLGSGVVFLSIYFGIEDPTSENPYALAMLENEKELLKKYIKDVPQSLKNN